MFNTHLPRMFLTLKGTWFPKVIVVRAPLGAVPQSSSIDEEVTEILLVYTRREAPLPISAAGRFVCRVVSPVHLTGVPFFAQSAAAAWEFRSCNLAAAPAAGAG